MQTCYSARTRGGWTRTGASRVDVWPPGSVGDRASRWRPGPSVAPAGPVPSSRFAVERWDILMLARVGRQLGMEGERQAVSVLHRKRLAGVAGQFADVGGSF